MELKTVYYMTQWLVKITWWTMTFTNEKYTHMAQWQLKGTILNQNKIKWGLLRIEPG